MSPSPALTWLELNTDEITFSRKNGWAIDRYNPCVLSIKNISSEYVAFKIRLTAPNNYWFRRPRATLEPGGLIETRISARDDIPSTTLSSDKFLLEATVVQTNGDVSQEYWRRLNPNQMQTKKLQASVLDVGEQILTISGSWEDDFLLVTATLLSGDEAARFWLHPLVTTGAVRARLIDQLGTQKRHKLLSSAGDVIDPINDEEPIIDVLSLELNSDGIAEYFDDSSSYSSCDDAGLLETNINTHGERNVPSEGSDIRDTNLGTSNQGKRHTQMNWMLYAVLLISLLLVHTVNASSGQ